MDVFIMTYVKNTTVHKLKKRKKHHVYEDKNDPRRKVVIVRGTLLMPILCYPKYIDDWNVTNGNTIILIMSSLI